MMMVSPARKGDKTSRISSISINRSGVKRKAPVEVAELYSEDLGTDGLRVEKFPLVTVTGAKFEVPLTKEEEKKRQLRKARFNSSATDAKQDVSAPEGLWNALSSSRKDVLSPKKKLKLTDSKSSRFVGTNQSLEKPYFRLTTYPKQEDVRPLNVLIKAVAHIKSRYIQDEDFAWANEQMKSVRQDIVVQRLHNKFVLEVYETHARILLEHGDLDEFNTCQTMIRHLTSGHWEDEHGNLKDCEAIVQHEESADEFRAYGILYALVQNSWAELLREITRNLQFQGKGNHYGLRCRHAIQVVHAVIHSDYRAFFRLYDSAHDLSAYLMDFLVKRMRTGAYERIVSAYRPTISVEHFREALFFRDLHETRKFLKKSGAVFVKEQGEHPFWVDCEASK